MMTKRHFIAIAEAIRQEAVLQVTEERRLVARQIAENVADVLAQENPRFDRERFLDACGVDYTR